MFSSIPSRRGFARVISRTILLLVCAAASLLSQQPAISPGGIVNAATYSLNDPFPRLAPGSIASIFGTNLATGVLESTSLPIPRTLLGTSVTFDGIEAPLFYVSPLQINLQVPVAILPPGTTGTRLVTVAVRTPGGTASSVVVAAAHNLGIFTADRSGSGPGAIIIFSQDPGRLYLNAANPVRPGELIGVFGTGLGETTPTVPDGESPPADALAWSVSTPLVVIGGVPARVTYSGRSSYVGLDQINVEIPANVVEGCAVPMQILVGSSISQMVPLFIRRSGTCN